MCGIIGYIGPKVAYPILLTGLKRMEYRGYDSAGISTISIEDNQRAVNIVKKQGKVSNLENKQTELQGNLGLAHTRWATHGQPSELNSHPHFNDDKSLMLVHNGIIENYLTIKRNLEQRGYVFHTQTDTEVLTKLIDYYHKKCKQKLSTTLQNYEQKKDPLELALRAALHDVVGAYGIVLFHKDTNKLYAAKHGSPLVIGIGKNEHFVASDPAAFLDHTRRVLYLEDEDIAIIKENSYELKSLCSHNGECIKRKEDLVDWDITAVEKNGYEHFMLKEIMEQPQTLANCLAGRLDPQFNDIKFTLKLTLNFIKNIKRISIIACGTSSYAAMAGKFLIEKYLRIPTEVEVASEWRYKNPIISKDDLVIVISQSGETADTLAALKLAKQFGAKTFGIINVVGSTMSREVDSGIYIHAGPEICVASTKAFTAQVLCLNFLLIKLGKIRGDLTETQIQRMISNLLNTPELVKQSLNNIEQIKAAANLIKDKQSIFYLGRGINFATAKEGAIKIKEISYIHAEDFASGEMKHGPIALLEKGFPVVTFVNKNDPLYEKNLSSIQEAKARGAYIIVVADHIDSTLQSYADTILQVPKVPDYLQPLINTIPLQLLAYYTAKLRGCEIDQPKNLAKSVTVE